jgi:hypothetical protein
MLSRQLFLPKSQIVSAILFVSASNIYAESVVTLEDAELLVDDIASEILGTALTLTDVAYSGEDAQIGTFSDFEFLFGNDFGTGILLGTGKVRSVMADVNTDDKATTEFSEDSVNDADLGQNVYDPAKLSLTFYPSYSTITLDFIFGSEEYNEYVGSKYNDRIEILVNGQNCAKTPDGKSFSVNTVNDRANYPPLFAKDGLVESANPELYVNNDPGTDSRKNPAVSEDSVSLYQTEMDGYTKLIRCTATVLPNEENSLVIGIVDEGDAKYDSWVFFRSNSLTSPVDPTPEPDPIQDPTIDSDNDGIPNGTEAPDGNAIDSDNDGIPNYLDLDSDNDGIPDSIEYQGDLAVDKDMDGHLDESVTMSISVTTNPVDTDKDGIADYLDLDSDNDSLTDLLESLPAGVSLSELDSNQDGILDDATDSDSDGLFDVVDPQISNADAGTTLLLLDLDNDGLFNYRDVDSDGDQFEDDIENGDYDKDGINDRLQKQEGLKTAVSGIGLGAGWEFAVLLLGVVLFRRKRIAE